MRRCCFADADDLCRDLCTARGVGACRSTHAAGDVHGGVQLSLDMVGDIAVIYRLLPERKLAETVSGDLITRGPFYDIFNLIGDILIDSRNILCYNNHRSLKGDTHMYINDLGIGRIDATGSVGRVAAVNNRNNITRRSNAATGKTSGDYATVMKQAVDNQKSTVTPTFSTAGDIIIQEAFKKMETDPEWEESVMDKVKDYYSGSYVANNVQTSYLNLTGQNSLQNYLIQSLIGGSGSLGLGLTGYSPYGVSSLASSAYGNVMNSALGSSFFGNWQL